jgi:hypothetical protein
LVSCQKSVDNSAADIQALKASVTALQKRSDSLAAALALTNINIGTLGKSVDSIRVQLTGISYQIGILTLQLTTINANVTAINAQISDLNQKYIDLLAKLNAILAQLTNTTAYLNARIDSLSASIIRMQKTSDSLKNALAITNNNLSSFNKTVDTIRIQLVFIVTQINQLSIQLTYSNANIPLINAQLTLLNQQYIDLLAALNAILAQLTIIPNSLSSGLIAYYPFTGNANDSSGNGINGTVYGATLAADRFGNSNSAYSFTKTNANYISLPLLSSLNGASTASFSFWMLSKNLSNNGTIFGHSSNNNGRVGINCGIAIEQASSNGELGVYNYSGAGGIISPSISINKWHHVVVNLDFNQTINTSKVIVYIDNVFQSMTFGLFNNAIGMATSSYLGRRNTDFNTYGAYFDGVIDNFRIYNRTLSQSEITYLATH